MRFGLLMAALLVMLTVSDADAFGRRHGKRNKHCQSHCTPAACTPTSAHTAYAPACASCVAPAAIAADYNQPQPSGNIQPQQIQPAQQIQPQQIQPTAPAPRLRLPLPNQIQNPPQPD
jgi:hypothetical protein